MAIAHHREAPLAAARRHGSVGLRGPEALRALFARDGLRVRLRFAGEGVTSRVHGPICNCDERNPDVDDDRA